MAASGEFDPGGIPARNRAVSSGVAGSALRAGAAIRASKAAMSAAAIIFGIVKDMLLQATVRGVSGEGTFESRRNA